jgi:hypothetical protein
VQHTESIDHTSIKETNPARWCSLIVLHICVEDTLRELNSFGTRAQPGVQPGPDDCSRDVWHAVESASFHGIENGCLPCSGTAREDESVVRCIFHGAIYLYRVNGGFGAKAGIAWPLSLAPSNGSAFSGQQRR